MKNIFLTFTLGIAVLTACSQSLTFNQVLTYSGQTTPPDYFGPIFSVPAGKIWKIESFFLNNGISSKMTYRLNGQQLLLPCSSCALDMIHFPIWLKAGDTIQPDGDGSSQNISYFISIIEFNAP